MDKVQIAKAAASYANSAKEQATSDYEHNMADALLCLALAITEDFREPRNP